MQKLGHDFATKSRPTESAREIEQRKAHLYLNVSKDLGLTGGANGGKPRTLSPTFEEMFLVSFIHILLNYCRVTYLQVQSI